MRCRKVREKLDRYLAGECKSSEAGAMEKHLGACHSCAAELQQKRKLDSLLNLWQSEPAPGDLWESVMAGVAGEADRAKVKQTPGKRFSLQLTAGLGYLMRDLVVAAVVSLALFWNIGPWADGGHVLAAGKNINGAVAAYTRTADNIIERLTETAGEYTRKIIFEEWEQR